MTIIHNVEWAQSLGNDPFCNLHDERTNTATPNLGNNNPRGYVKCQMADVCIAKRLFVTRGERVRIGSDLIGS